MLLILIGFVTSTTGVLGFAGGLGSGVRQLGSILDSMRVSIRAREKWVMLDTWDLRE